MRCTPLSSFPRTTTERAYAPITTSGMCVGMQSQHGHAGTAQAQHRRYRHRTGTAQVEYSTGTAQAQHRYSTGTAQAQSARCRGLKWAAIGTVRQSVCGPSTTVLDRQSVCGPSIDICRNPLSSTASSRVVAFLLRYTFGKQRDLDYATRHCGCCRWWKRAKKGGSKCCVSPCTKWTETSPAAIAPGIDTAYAWIGWAPMDRA